MISDAEFAALRADVDNLKDRAAIIDCIARHARGCDRHDLDLITSAYHHDAVDEHRFASNAGPEYGEWANTSHAATSEVHTHNITTHLCDIDGDTAHAESYVLVVLVNRGKAQVLSGRYLDRLERREGTWRIALRRSTVEVAFGADASMLTNPFFQKMGYPRGTRDHGDVSYARPLLLETPVPERW